MATTKAITANAKKNNGGTLLHAGNHDGSNITKALDLTNNAANKYNYGSEVIKAVSPDSSGNIGTTNARTGDFAKMATENFISPAYNTYTVANSLTVNNATAADTGDRKPVNAHQGYQRLDITSWDAATGAATTGANAGVTVQPSGIDNVVGPKADEAAHPTRAIPGELVYMTTGKLPTKKDYASLD